VTVVDAFVSDGCFVAAGLACLTCLGFDVVVPPGFHTVAVFLVSS
jgi:hypothetical protein